MKKNKNIIPASKPRNPLVAAMIRVTKPGKHKNKKRTQKNDFNE